MSVAVSCDWCFNPLGTSYYKIPGIGEVCKSCQDNIKFTHAIPKNAPSPSTRNVALLGNRVYAPAPERPYLKCDSCPTLACAPFAPGDSCPNCIIGALRFLPDARIDPVVDEPETAAPNPLFVSSVPIVANGTAPCGHPGEHIFGSYVRCLSGCEGAVAEKVIPSKAQPECRHSYAWSEVAGGSVCRRCGAKERFTP